MIDPELDGWDKIIAEADGGNENRWTAAKVKASQKMVLAISNLGNSIFSLQKVSGIRLEDLQKSIDRFNDSSTKLYIVYLWLTGAIVVLTLLNVILVGISIFKR